MISFEQKGDWSKTFNFLRKHKKFDISDLNKYGAEGVRALAAATPTDTGKTADSWDYRIVRGKDYISIEWLNYNIVDDVLIAVILQYGHGTGTGGYVQGIDYINPALAPLFNEIADNAWREVTSE